MQFCSLLCSLFHHCPVFGDCSFIHFFLCNLFYSFRGEYSGELLNPDVILTEYARSPPTSFALQDQARPPQK